MKRLFEKVQASKPFVAIPKTFSAGFGPNPTSSSSAPDYIIPHTVGLQPKFIVPPVPHPRPYDHLALVATNDGLLIRQHIPGHDRRTESPTSYVRVSWGKSIQVEEISDSHVTKNIDWSDSVIVYGIIGVLELFSGSHLLVISSAAEIGKVIEASHTVYCVKAVTAIPLEEEKAIVALSSLAARNAKLARPSLIQSSTLDSVSSSKDDEEDVSLPVEQSSGLPMHPRVRFSPTNDIKMMTPTNPSFNFDNHSESAELRSLSSHQSSSSDLSLPSTEQPISSSPVAKTLATRLSFWSRLSKRNSLPQSTAEAAPTPRHSLIEEQDSLDKIIQDSQEPPATIVKNILAATAPPPASVEEKHSELEDKIIRECVREYTKGGMYFAYNFDITRSLQQKQDQISKSQKKQALLSDLNALPSPPESSRSQEAEVEGAGFNLMSEPNPTLPLWRRVDRRFWWNEWLSKPFVDAGLHSYVLPIIQGYYQVAHFNIPPDPVTHDEDVLVEYMIISRRSRYRAGLRYQRRGIDDDANVANFVETETIMRVERLGVENIFSYVQLRGSIPLYWTQSGYGLKPPPLLASDRTRAQNLDVLKRHFKKTVALYGPHTVLNLAEQHGKEGAITQGYRDYMKELDSPNARYCEYDFHQETRGMKYENISKLTDTLDKTFDAQGYFWASDNTIMSQQRGVFRVNCIDCLDRTNVVQSAFARYILNKQLGAVALLNPQGEVRTETDIVFNDVWANNGDAISRAYSGTSALKGDFTRTGKRDLSGMLNDGVNSLARMYTSTFSDWFSQAVIDFMLGYRTISVFSEFLLKLQSTDPRDLIRLSKIRAEAIATSVSRVLPEGERLLSGWTLFAPEELNVKIGDKFEEKVLLLTINALYIISYDYTLEKVKLYTRVPLGDITGITQGAYILSPLEEASRDPLQNAGFVITWHNYRQMTRVTSYSIKNDVETTARSLPTSILPGLAATTRQSALNAGSMLSRSLTRSAKAPFLSNIVTNSVLATGSQTTFAAFKVLPIDPARIRRGSSVGGNVEYLEAADELSGAASCKEAASLIVESIHRACKDIGNDHPGFLTDGHVVSLSEAQRMTSMYAKMEYGVKRLLWLGG